MMRLTLGHLALIFVLIGCAPKNPLEPLRLDPGTYRQNVSIQTQRGDHFSFEAVLLKREDHLYLIGLDPVGFTLFRLEDDESPDRPVIRIFQEQFRKWESSILDLYISIRPIFFEKTGPQESTHAEVRVLKRDIKGRAEEFKVIHYYFTATIKNKRLKSK